MYFFKPLCRSVCVFPCLTVCVCVCMCVTSRLVVWLRAWPWEAAGWHQRTNCTHNNVRFHVNGQPLWPSLHGIGPSPPISVIPIIAFRGPSNYVVPLALTSILTENYPFHTGIHIVSLYTACPSASVSFCTFPPPLFPFLLVCFSLSLPPSLCVLLLTAVFLGGWTGSMVVWSQWHCTFSPLSLSSSLPLSILGCASTAVYRRCSPKVSS